MDNNFNNQNAYNNNYNNNYQQNGYEQMTHNYKQSEMEEVMSVKDWILTHLVMLIPIANIVLLIIWSLKSPEKINKNKKNWAVAQLIMTVISSVIAFVFVFMFSSVLMLGFAGAMGSTSSWEDNYYDDYDYSSSTDNYIVGDDFEYMVL